MIEFKKIILKNDDEDDFKIKIFITGFNKKFKHKKKKKFYFSLKKLVFNIKFY